MKIKNVLVDAHDNVVTVGDLVKNSAEDKAGKSYRVVYAHVDIVNDNKLQLTADSIQTTRDRYPVLVEHADNRVEDVVGYITTDGKPNEAGEFVGELTFYDNTPQAQHAEQLWRDGVINELSVSYYIKDYDVMDDGDYVRVNSAILKEVSLVSVGADRNTGEVAENKDAPADVTPTVTMNGEDPEAVPADVTPTVTTDKAENDQEDELEKIRLNVLRSALLSDAVR